MTKSKPKLIFIPIVVIIIISIGAGALSIRYIRSRAKKAKIVAETPSAQSKVEDASD
jgi:flagellar basal body-associated protein FliL